MPGGRLLHGERRTDAPLAAHADAEQRPEHEEAPVAGGEAGEYLDDRVEDEVDHERESAPVAIGEKAEEEGADRPEGERQGDRERDGGVRGVELLRDRGEGEDDEEEVERVERPAEEGGQDRGPVPAGAVVGGEIAGTVQRRYNVFAHRGRG